MSASKTAYLEAADEFLPNDLALDLTVPQWHKQAACKDAKDPDLWHPEPGERDREVRAKKICERCPVKKECLEDALSRPVAKDYGIWGGTSANERIKIRRRRKGMKPTKSEGFRRQLRLQECAQAIWDAQLFALFGTEDLKDDEAQIDGRLETSPARIIADGDDVVIYSGQDELGRFTREEFRETIARRVRPK